jgi:hypothetical protein
LVDDLRRFAPKTKAIEAAWSGAASSGDVWSPTGVRFGTSCEPVQVRNAAGLLGVKKPGAGIDRVYPYMPATEKIVADLAFALGLPVPPVTLWNAGDGKGGPLYHCVSAWAFTAPVTWSQVKDKFPGASAAALIPAMSAMVPFETWIDAKDRHGENVLLAAEPAGRPVVAWIDYAFSLDFVWKGNPTPIGALAPHNPPFGSPDRDVMIEVADRISAIDDGIVEEIINRIPADCLPQAVAKSICSNLLVRRKPLRALW